MPQFEYECKNCRYHFDRVVARWDTAIQCPICNGDVHKLISAFTVGSSQKDVAEALPDIRPKMCSNC